MFDHIGDTFLADSIFLRRLPSAGGVYSPGYAFADTTLVSRFTSSFPVMNGAVDLCPNIENCTLQKDLGKWENPNILAAIFLFPQVEQKGRDIHICGRGYLIWPFFPTKDHVPFIWFNWIKSINTNCKVEIEISC